MKTKLGSILTYEVECIDTSLQQGKVFDSMLANVRSVIGVEVMLLSFHKELRNNSWHWDCNAVFTSHNGNVECIDVGFIDDGVTTFEASSNLMVERALKTLRNKISMMLRHVNGALEAV